MEPPSPVSEADSLAGFDSGNSVLDSWLTSRALRNEAEGASRTYVIRDGGRVVGYYSLATGSVLRAQTPGRVRRNMPDPVPVMVLGRLAVARSHQGCGLAHALVRDAIFRTLRASEIAGIRVLLVHAVDEEAAGFYAHLQFARSPTDPLLFMLPLADAREAFGSC